MLAIFPLLVVVVVIYNLLALLGPGVAVASTESMTEFLQQVLFTVPMISTGKWTVSIGDLILVASLLLLFVEVIKSTRTDKASMIDHGLSMLLFVICIVEFIVLPRFATSVFFLITLMTGLDVVGGFTVSLVAARRDMEVTSPLVH